MRQNDRSLGLMLCYKELPVLATTTLFPYKRDFFFFYLFFFFFFTNIQCNGARTLYTYYYYLLLRRGTSQSFSHALQHSSQRDARFVVRALLIAFSRARFSPAWVTTGPKCGGKKYFEKKKKTLRTCRWSARQSGIILPILSRRVIFVSFIYWKYKITSRAGKTATTTERENPW